MKPFQRVPFDRHEAERLLAALAGVVSAHVVTDGDDRPVEIHVLATAELHPKQVVRNVESALSAGLGITIDRRIVSVAQIRADTNGGTQHRAAPLSPDTGSALAEPTGAGPPEEAEEEGARLEYVRYEARRDQDRCTCEVVLREEGRDVVGSGRGPDTMDGRAEAAAGAVLDAIMKARPGLELRLEGATATRTRSRGYIIVSVRAVVDRSPLSLAGAAEYRHSPEEAAILASLQAANRWTG